MDEEKKATRLTPRRPDQQLYVPRQRQGQPANGSTPKSAGKRSGKTSSASKVQKEAKSGVSPDQKNVAGLNKTLASNSFVVDSKPESGLSNDSLDKETDLDIKLESCPPEVAIASHSPSSMVAKDLPVNTDYREEIVAQAPADRLLGRTSVSDRMPSSCARMEGGIAGLQSPEEQECKDQGFVSIVSECSGTLDNHDRCFNEEEDAGVEMLQNETAADSAFRNDFPDQMNHETLHNTFENVTLNSDEGHDCLVRDESSLQDLTAVKEPAKSDHCDVSECVDAILHDVESNGDFSVENFNEAALTCEVTSSKTFDMSSPIDVQTSEVEKEKNSGARKELKKSKSGTRKMKVTKISNKDKHKKKEMKAGDSMNVDPKVKKSEVQLGPTRKDKANGDDDDDDDDWELKWNEEGNCLSKEANDELKKLTGIEKPIAFVPEKPEIDYLSFEPEAMDLDVGDYGHLVEIHDFSPNLKTTDISLALQTAGLKDFDIKWVDDIHAIGVFSSIFQAQQAVKMNFIQMKVRRIIEGTKATKLKARSFKDMLLPYKPRPETTATVARNLVTSALGVKSNTSKAQRDKERQRLKEAKERKRMERKQRADVWED